MDTIVYQVGEKLYINLTNKCSNNCEFCIRREGESAYGSNSLWLKKEPTAAEVISSLAGHPAFATMKEAVFCGYGEPTYKIAEMVEIGKFLKSNKKTVRVNTNGQGNLICGEDITDKLFEAVDIVNVSLNQSDAKKYQDICHSIYGEQAFFELIQFTELCVKRGITVVMSVVDVIDSADIEICRNIAKSLGAKFRVRKYD